MELGKYYDVTKSIIKENIAVQTSLLEDSNTIALLCKIVHEITNALAKGNKLLLFGNGGSAADAQHIAAEFVGRYLKERQALPAVALSTNTSILTAVGNDYSFNDIFARQVEAFGQSGDVAIGISTSGNSSNVLRGLHLAKTRNLITVGLTGRSGGHIKNIVDYCIRIPSDDTPRIQEGHILIGHILAEIVEDAVCGA